MNFVAQDRHPCAVSIASDGPNDAEAFSRFRAHEVSWVSKRSDLFVSIGVEIRGGREGREGRRGVYLRSCMTIDFIGERGGDVYLGSVSVIKAAEVAPK